MTPPRSRLQSTPKIAVLIFTDGRKEYFSTTFQSFKENVTAKDISYQMILDDSNDPNYASHLDNKFRRDVDYVEHHEKRLGFGGTIRETWNKLNKIVGDFDYVFHLEDDFTFNRPINLDDLVLILESNPDMAQVCLLRQPWNENEIKAGGLWQQNPDRFTQESVDGPDGKIYYLKHRQGFSTNPSLYPKWVVALGWPEGLDSEERFWNERLSPKNSTCSYFGSKSDPPAVFHIGSGRLGIGY